MCVLSCCADPRVHQYGVTAMYLQPVIKHAPHPKPPNWASGTPAGWPSLPVGSSPVTTVRPLTTHITPLAAVVSIKLKVTGHWTKLHTPASAHTALGTIRSSSRTIVSSRARASRGTFVWGAELQCLEGRGLTVDTGDQSP